MAVVAVLGAGAMGSGLTTPAVSANQVRLWGTWLDDEILADLRAGRPHRATKVGVDGRVRLFDSGALAEAMDGAEVVVLAISSDGVLDVLAMAAPHLRPGTVLPFVTKGFGRDERSRVQLLPPLLEGVLPAELRATCPLVAIGGPCKANEVAAARPTASVYAAREAGVAAAVAGLFGTDAYRIEVSDDVAGVEISAAMKNVYAIALGVCDGLGEGDGEPWHDLRSAVFTRAVTEMRSLAALLGGREATVTGLAGTGDLEVTGLSGRNKRYGMRIGRGETPGQALEAMAAAGQTVEGAPAARLARDLAEQRSGDLPPGSLLLLEAVNRILDGAGDPAGLLAAAALPARWPPTAWTGVPVGRRGLPTEPRGAGGDGSATSRGEAT
jgi:glycerol-3-phosphate dehydrogenase (NAD(P)+)